MLLYCSHRSETKKSQSGRTGRDDSCSYRQERSAMDLGLRGKYAIVTGGGRGIGKAIARELACEGVDLAIVSRYMEQLEATAHELSAETGQRIIPLAADVVNKEQVDRVVAQAVERLGGLHILVNSAAQPGGTATGPIETIVDAELLHD